MTRKIEYMEYEDILEEAKDPHVTADMLNLLVTRTKELSAKKSHDNEKLQALLEKIEARLAEK